MTLFKKPWRNTILSLSDPKHVHREMLKTFAYFALADGEGILIRATKGRRSPLSAGLLKCRAPVRSVELQGYLGWPAQSCDEVLKPRAVEVGALYRTGVDPVYLARSHVQGHSLGKIQS